MLKLYDVINLHLFLYSCCFCIRIIPAYVWCVRSVSGSRYIITFIKLCIYSLFIGSNNGLFYTPQWIRNHVCCSGNRTLVRKCSFISKLVVTLWRCMIHADLLYRYYFGHCALSEANLTHVRDIVRVASTLSYRWVLRIMSTDLQIYIFFWFRCWWLQFGINQDSLITGLARTEVIFSGNHETWLTMLVLTRFIFPPMIWKTLLNML